MTGMPALETERLIIRPLVMDDLDAIHCILDVELAEVDFGGEEAKTLDTRRAWLQWTILSYDQLARLYQPPYGERAIALKSTGVLIGAAGYVPCLNVFGQLPAFGGRRDGLASTEFGLYYALSPAHHRRGYATEAVRAMIDYAFRQLRLRRIVATTTYNNEASMGVMRKVGMRVERNPYPDPPWLQAVGFLENS